MKNYRPVSNLRFLSKVLKKVVVNHLNTHINSSSTSNQYQSAHRKFHSTKTALLKSHNDILASICWPTKPCVKNSLLIFTPCLLHRFLPVRWDQTMIIVCHSLGSRPILVLEVFTLVPPSLWNNLPLSVHSASSVTTFKKYLKTHLFDLAFPPWILSLPMACWCYGTVSLILLLNTDLAVVPLSLASPGILVI